MVKYTGRGLVVKRPGGLRKVQMLNLVLGVGVFSLLPTEAVVFYYRRRFLQSVPFSCLFSSEQLPCRSAEVNFFSIFSAKGVVKFGVKFW